MSRDRRITPRDEDYSTWYNDVLLAGDLVDESPTRGAVVLKPNGYALWEQIKVELDKKIKEAGHKNAYFPLLIPKSLLQKENNHVSGFALESAVVTHHRLTEVEGELQADPESKLTEEYIIRPTSEAIINYSFARWINSYRDLPLLINQWANVVRWEMRTRPFLRTSEFLWQEGHTAHINEKDALAEQKWALDMYASFLKDYLAISFISGSKSESEKFAGAETTFTLEAMMQDGKALQCCTSHNLGQNFAKAFNITYTDKENNNQSVWQTSWGLSTRIIGAIIMSHSDDNGLILPPKIAPVQVRIIVLNKDNDPELLVQAKKIQQMLSATGIRLELDTDDHLSFGERIYRAEKEGIPLRLEFGPRDLNNNEIVLVPRLNSYAKETVNFASLGDKVHGHLESIQSALLAESESRLHANLVSTDNFEEFESLISDNKFVLAPWDGNEETEAKVKEKTTATIRCIPFNQPGNLPSTSIYSDANSVCLAVFAKAY